MASTTKKPRGKPFAKGDARINREGISKEKLDLKEFVRELAREVLQAEIKVPGALPEGSEVQSKKRITKIFEAIADKAEMGSIEHAEYLTTWAYGRPPQEVEVTGKDGGPIVVFDLPCAVVKRAMDEEQRK